MAHIQVQPREEKEQQHQAVVINNGSEEEEEKVQPREEEKQQQKQAVAVVINNGSEKEKEKVNEPKSLYVGDLEPNVTDAQIQELFQQVGPVASVRICRDAMTKASLGYGYVNYSTPENASEALRSLNFTPLNGKPIRIMYSHRDPNIRNSGSANIFIKNLHKAVDNKTLYHKFSVFGPILSSKIATDASGQSKGYGFVHFENEAAAQNAIKCMNGELINDAQVYVAPFMKKEEREKTKLMKKEERQPEPESKFKNVFVNNLSETMNEEDLKKYFDEYGKIISVAVMRDDAGKSKCFGFVNFENADDAAKCVDSLNGKKIQGKEWYVGKAFKKSELKEQSGTNLYLKHLDDSIDENKLRELFSIYGTITSCKVMRDLHGHSKGSGFVSFSSPHEASRALAEMDKKVVMGKPLYVALAQQKEERKKKLQSRFSEFPNRVANIEPRVCVGVPMYNRGGMGMEPTICLGVPTYNRGGPTSYHPIGMVPTPRGLTSYHPIRMVPTPRGPTSYHPIGIIPPPLRHPTLYHPVGMVPTTFPPGLQRPPAS